MSDKNFVFVYGTLKKGHHANGMMQRQRSEGEPMGTNYLGKAKIEGFKLYDLGGFPCVMKTDDPTLSVEGEVYCVNDSQLKALDSYEGVSSGLFSRIMVTPDCYGLEKEVSCFVYQWGDKFPPNHGKDISKPLAEWRPRNAKDEQPLHK
jgi:gamma-glutamylcyclotransferase (GGCT)/AIG2-like uncharacterized protein YtfP